MSLVATFGVLAGLEMGLRAAGFVPSLNDTPSLWTYHRTRAVGEDPVVLLGFSRMLLAIDPEVLSERLDRPVVQLAINASSPMPILADLAADTSFAGLVWLSLVSQDFYRTYGVSEEYVARGRSSVAGLNARLNREFGWFLAEHLALRGPQARLLAWWDGLVLGTGNAPPNFTMTRDRFRRGDYSRMDHDELRAGMLRRADEFLEPWRHMSLDRETMMDSIAVMEDRIAAIRERGGDVVIIRLPVTGGQKALEDELFPRAQFWDALAERTSARTLHFEDYPTLRDYYLPDDSHLDYRDSAAFTLALAEALGH